MQIHVEVLKKLVKVTYTCTVLEQRISQYKYKDIIIRTKDVRHGRQKKKKEDGCR